MLSLYNIAAYPFRIRRSISVRENNASPHGISFGSELVNHTNDIYARKRWKRWTFAPQPPLFVGGWK